MAGAARCRCGLSPAGEKATCTVPIPEPGLLVEVPSESPCRPSPAGKHWDTPLSFLRCCPAPRLLPAELREVGIDCPAKALEALGKSSKVWLQTPRHLARSAAPPQSLTVSNAGSRGGLARRRSPPAVWDPDSEAAGGL